MSYSQSKNAKNAEILSPGEPVINRPNPAVQSLKKFGSMAHNAAANALNYANPVTLAKNVWDKAGQLPDKMEEYDRNYGQRVKNNLAQPNPNHYFPTPMNPTGNKPAVIESDLPPSKYDNSQSQYDNSTPTTRNADHIEVSQVPEMRADPQHPADVNKYDYSSGQAFNQGQLDTHQREQKHSDVNRPSPYDGKQITPSNWRSPGKQYNDMDKSELLTESGERAYDDNGQQIGVPLFDQQYMTSRYSDSHKPRSEAQRIYEGKLAHNRVLRGLAAYQNLNHYRRTGKDKFFAPQPGYDMSAYQPNPEQAQQDFDNQLAVRKHGLDIQKRNDALDKRPDDSYQSVFQDIYGEDGFTPTGKEFQGRFNTKTGQYTEANQSQPVDLDNEQVSALSRARELSITDEDYLSEYQKLLKELGLDESWYQQYGLDEDL